MSLHIDPEQAQHIAKLKHDAVPAAVYTTAGTSITVLGIGIDQVVSILAAILTLCQLIKFFADNRKGIVIFCKRIKGVLLWWRK